MEQIVHIPRKYRLNFRTKRNDKPPRSHGVQTREEIKNKMDSPVTDGRLGREGLQDLDGNGLVVLVHDARPESREANQGQPVQNKARQKGSKDHVPEPDEDERL